MPDNDPAEDDSQRGVSTKAVEMVVAAAILVLGLVVMADSRRVGAGWADDGPQAGYFPFYIGLILCFASAWTLWRTLFSGKDTTGVFVSRKKLTAGAVGIHTVHDLCRRHVLHRYLCRVRAFYRRVHVLAWPLPVDQDHPG